MSDSTHDSDRTLCKSPYQTQEANSWARHRGLPLRGWLVQGYGAEALIGLLLPPHKPTHLLEGSS